MINKKKLFILIGFLGLFILFFSFNNKVFAVDYDVEVNHLLNVGITNNKIVEGSQTIDYISTESGYLYTIIMNSTVPQKVYVTINSPSLGSDITSVVTLQPGESYSFIGSSNYYLVVHGGQTYVISATRTPINGINGAVDDLVDNLTLDKLWGGFKNAVPLIAIGSLFTLGFIVFKVATRNTSKHKSGFQS